MAQEAAHAAVRPAAGRSACRPHSPKRTGTARRPQCGTGQSPAPHGAYTMCPQRGKTRARRPRRRAPPRRTACPQRAEHTRCSQRRRRRFPPTGRPRRSAGKTRRFPAARPCRRRHTADILSSQLPPIYSFLPGRAGQRAPYRRIPIRSYTTAEASTSPAAAGTNGRLPGVCRRVSKTASVSTSPRGAVGSSLE